jgi:hypothetical protein
MNERITEIIQLGIVFGVVVVFLDAFLPRVPSIAGASESLKVLSWMALSLAFFFVAVLIVESVMKLVPIESQRSTPNTVPQDELQHLSRIIYRAIERQDQEAQSLLVEKLRSIVQSNLAAGMNLSRREIAELAEQGSLSLPGVVNDQQMLELLANKVPKSVGRQQVDQLLSKIEGLSR